MLRQRLPAAKDGSHRSTKIRVWRIRLVAGGLLLLALSCTFGEPGGFRLGVPYRKQAQFNYCTAASVLMWRLFDGLPEIDQSVIFNSEGGAGCTTIDRVAAAVRSFTANPDAYWDRDTDPDFYLMISRQAASISNGVPVLPVVRFNHTGIIDGGQWQLDQTGVYYIWDFVYFHDPDYNLGGPDLYIGATDWIQNFCQAGQGYCDQVIASGAIAGWQQDETKYGPQVRVGGGGRKGGPYAM